MSLPFAVTLGRGLARPVGREVVFEAGDIVGGFARRLMVHSGREAWISPGVFRSGRRRRANWSSSFVVGVDVDNCEDGKHVRLVGMKRARVLVFLRRQKCSGTLAHMTPRGFRVYFLFCEPIVCPSKWQAAARMCCARLRADMAASGLAGLEVDVWRGCFGLLVRLLRIVIASLLYFRLGSRPCINGQIFCRYSLKMSR